jgi:putative restriction endonuclease
MHNYDKVHRGILKKFQCLKGRVLQGKKEIKGANSEERIPADELVPEQHILHDLIRGFYKPKGKNYLLSYQATESKENYGKQIKWMNDEELDFEVIEMRPPSGEKDNRKKSDIRAARYNLEHRIPIGILHKVSKGKNKILGLGIIEEERTDGVFIVKPYFTYSASNYNSTINEDFSTEYQTKITQRIGQDKFRKALLEKYSCKCQLCDIGQSELLVASHIKPWDIASDIERLDVNNGLLLCANHDKLFDRGLISFEGEQIVISASISNQSYADLNISLDLVIEMGPATKEYMKWHCENVFKN